MRKGRGEGHMGRKDIWRRKLKKGNGKIRKEKERHMVKQSDHFNDPPKVPFDPPKPIVIFQQKPQGQLTVRNEFIGFAVWCTSICNPGGYLKTSSPKKVNSFVNCIIIRSATIPL